VELRPERSHGRGSLSFSNTYSCQGEEHGDCQEILSYWAGVLVRSRPILKIMHPRLAYLRLTLWPVGRWRLDWAEASGGHVYHMDRFVSICCRFVGELTLLLKPSIEGSKDLS
jgi:hypothetical protein